MAISSEELEKLLEAKARGEMPNTFLLDIRETAETEMGTMPGAKVVRFYQTENLLDTIVSANIQASMPVAGDRVSQ